jgi:alpha-mannosidase
MGYRLYRVLPSPVPTSSSAAPSAAQGGSAGAAETDGVLPEREREFTEPSDPRVAAENEFFSVVVDPADGTLTLMDRESGAVYSGLNGFVDSGEAGDEYTHCPPPRDLCVERPVAAPEVTLPEAGPARTTVLVRQTYLLPESLDAEREARSERLVPCAVETRVSLYPGVRRVDVETVVDNRARDHLLRVRFPTGLAAQRSSAEGHFAVESRPIGQPDATVSRDWPEQPTATFPNRGFVDVSDGRQGLLVAARGLPEAAVEPTDGGAAIYLTLLRCVGWLSRDDLATRQGAAGPGLPTPGAQCLGRHVFQYTLVPHRGNWEEAAAEARAFAVPCRTAATEARAGVLPAELSFLSLSPRGLVLSAVKPPEEGDGFVVRVYNPTDSAKEARLEVWRPLARAELASLNEEGQGELPVDGRVVRFAVGAGQVVTLRLHLT